jgi:predicted membrane-bound spermidine synthase
VYVVFFYLQVMQAKAKFLYLLSFLEGAAVMAAELIGAKMLAPYFGSSLYVWSSVMAITLGGLALGYFCGGRLSSRFSGLRIVYYVLFLASMLVIVMPLTSKLVLSLVGLHALLPAVVFSTCVFLAPPVFMLGMVSPLIIRNLTTDAVESGKAAGAVYAISTLGGILATFATGFWIIPHFGLSRPCLFIGLGLGVLPALQLFKTNKTLLLFCLLLITFVFYKTNRPVQLTGLNILYRSEGLLGQIVVTEYPLEKGTAPDYRQRLLFVNRISQTVFAGSSTYGSSSYVSEIQHTLRATPNRGAVLVCGLGAGALVESLSELGFQVDVCELDPRITFVARTFFGLTNDVPVYTDDARHFLRQCKKKYAVCILDLFKGEENPGHCFTQEAFEEMADVLSPGGVLIVNGHGFVSGPAGAGSRALYLTLKLAGYTVSVVPTEKSESERNLVYYARKGEKDKVMSANTQVQMEDFIQVSDQGMTDDRPVLDQLNAPAYQKWREATIAFFASESRRGKSFPVFD